ncbi:MAG: cell division protein SepF [Clostridia bacterium]|nr:cell division protein SepF [Clostridia bacterium]
MATGSFFGNLKDKMRTMYSNFFFDEDAEPAPRMRQEAEPMDPYYTQQPPQPAAWQNDPAPGQQQNPYQQPLTAYAQPAQAQPQAYQPRVYQNPVFTAAPQPQAQVQPQAQPAPQAQPRNRRMQQHIQQEVSNVVDFGAYQHTAFQQPQQAVPAPQQPQIQETPAAPAVSTVANARIINARGMGEIRSAITLLRNGDAVLIVLENISDPAEMRRLVDTLSGACYSLIATITKVSRYGVYLLAPQSMAVYADQTTNQMNGMPARQPARTYQPGYQAQRPVYQQPAAQPQQPAAGYANPYMNQQQAFAQRSAAPMEAAQPFYTRPAPAAAPTPAFATQQAGDGYAPDEAAAGAQ